MNDALIDHTVLECGVVIGSLYIFKLLLILSAVVFELWSSGDERINEMTAMAMEKKLFK